MANHYTSDVIGKKVKQALNFVNNADNVWVGVGQTSAWGTPDEPPPVPFSSNNLNGLVGMQKAEHVHLIVPDDINGSIEHLTMKWRIVEPAHALNESARWVYVNAWLTYNSFPAVTYRQAGVFEDVVRADGVLPGKTMLLPAEIDNVGFLYVALNRGSISHSVDQKENIEFIIEF